MNDRRLTNGVRARRMRRGVASVLAMMFLVLFGSLAAAMAVVAQGNMRTADSGIKLNRAMSAAETGMVFAQRRLAQEAARFVVEKGTIDTDFAQKMWDGTYDQGADGAVEILQPSGYMTGPGIVDALLDVHSNDTHYLVSSDQPFVNSFGTLFVPPIVLDDVDQDGNPAYFSLRYELLDNVPYVRVRSEGVDADVHRVLEMDFKIDKKIEFAILSPSRIMIGKNVLIEGPLGSRYGLEAGELDGANGDPLVMRSDFYYLDDNLDAKLNLLYEKVVGFDVDGDSRLRPHHPSEALGLSGQSSLVDYDGDEYVDDCDLFLAHFDANSDNKVVYDAVLAGAPSEYGSAADDDLQLMRLIDLCNPDRDGDGDIGSLSDTGLGYNDGVIDMSDLYAKVRGRVGFSVAREAWETPHGASFQTVVQGPVRSEIDVPPMSFEVSSDEMREVTTEMFSTSQSWFENQAAGTLASGTGGTIEEPSETTGDPFDNTWEEIPFGAAGAYDYYNRRVYKDFTFTNVRIPKGTNALFENCIFVGVTYVETEEDCSDHDWNYAGALMQVPNSSPPVYVPKFAGVIDFATITSTGEQVPDTRTKSNNLRFHNCTFLGSISGDKPAGYTHWRNKLQMTGDTRFYIDQNDVDLQVQADVDDLMPLLNSIPSADKEEMEKSSILMPGWSVDVGNFFNELGPKVKLKGTIIAGIMDVRGTAEVHGTLLMTHKPVAGEGPLYYGGLADAFNTTVGYFGPNDGDGEGSDPSSTTFQGFGEITIRYNANGKLPDGIPWPLRIDADTSTYSE